MAANDVADMLLRIDATTEGLRRELKRADDTVAKSTAKINKQVSAVDKKFDEMSKSVKRSMAGVGAALSVAGLAKFTKSVSQAAQSIQSIERTFAAATGSMAAGRDELAFVRGEADRLGLNLESTAKSYAQLAAASKGTALEGQAVRDVFTSVSEASTALGLSSEQSEGALRALQQMMSKGTVQAEELRGQLGERIPGAFQLASRAMGVTTAQLGKMLENGEVLAEDLLPKLAVELSNTFGAQAAEGANQLTAQLNRLDTAIFDIFASADVSTFSDSIADLSETLSDPQIKKGLADLSGGIITLVGWAGKGAAALAELAQASGEVAAEFAIQNEENSFLYNVLTKTNGIGLVVAGTQAIIGRNTRNATAALQEFSGKVSDIVPTVTSYFDEMETGEGVLQRQAKATAQASGIMMQYAVEKRKLTAAEIAANEAMEKAAAIFDKQRIQLERQIALVIAGADAQEASARASYESKGMSEEQAKILADLSARYKELTKNTKEQINAEEKHEAAILAQLPALREQIRLLGEGYTPDQARYMSDLASATSDVEREQIKLNRQLDLAVDAYNENQKEIKKLKDQADPYAKAWEAAMERVDAAFANAWEGAFDSFESFSDSLLDSFKKLLAEMAHQAITKPIVMNVTSNLSGGLAGGGLNAAGGIGGITKMIGGLGGGATDWSAMAGGGTSVLAGGAGQSAIMSGIYNAGVGAAVAYGANSFVNALSDITSGKGNGFDALDVVFPGIGSAASSIKNAISGSGTRIKNYGVELGIDGGELSGRNYINKKKDRGYKSTRHWTVYDDLEADFADALQDAYSGTLDGVVSVFETLGTDVSDEMISSFSAEVERLSLSGKSDDEIAAAVEKFMGSVASDLADWISDTTYQEQIGIERLGELASALSAVNYGLEATGIAMLDLSRYGAELAEDLIKAAGGLESFAANMSAYDAFALTDADRLARTTKQLNELFTELGYDSLPATRGAVKDIVEGLDLTTESGQEAFAAITSASSLMSDYYGSQESAAASLAKAGKAAAAAAYEAEYAQEAAAAQAQAEMVSVANTLFPQMKDALRAAYGGQGGSYFGQFGGGGGTPIADMLAANLTAAEQLSAYAGTSLMRPEWTAAHEDLIAAYEAEYQAVNQTSGAINQSLESLRELARTSVGAVDTPVQNLHRLNEEFEKLTALGRSGDADALSKLSGVGSSLIDSITANASSAFEAAGQIAAVQASLGMTIGGASAAMSEEEERLDLLRKDLGIQAEIKDVVENGTFVIADKLEELRLSMAGQSSQLFNSGAFAQGYTRRTVDAGVTQASPMAGMQAQLEEQNKQLAEQREELRIGLAAIAKYTKDTSKAFDRFDGNTGLNVKVVS